MAINKGWDGRFMAGSTSGDSEVVHVNNWELSFSGDALENTAFGDTVYDRGYTAGLRSHTVSFSGYSDPADNSHSYLTDLMKSTIESDEIYFETQYDRSTPKGWSGKGVITGLTISTPVDGLAAFSGTIQVTDGLSTV